MQAILLAGGRGERLRPYTDDRPKPMVEVGGIPLIAYQLGWLRASGITQVVLSCGYQWHVLEQYLGDGQRWGLDIRYAVEREKLGRGGGIRWAMQHLSPGSDPVLVANGDNLVDIDVCPMLERHTRQRALVTLVLVPLVSVRGIVETDENEWVVRFREKPELPHWINAGIYIFARQVAPRLPAKGDHEDELLPRLAAEGVLHAYKTRELWRTVDTAKDLTELTHELEAGLRVPCLELPPAGKTLTGEGDDV